MCLPGVAGAKTTAALHESFRASGLPQSFETRKMSPPASIFPIDSGSSPSLRSRMTCAAEAVPTGCVRNTSSAGVAASCAGVGSGAIVFVPAGPA